MDQTATMPAVRTIPIGKANGRFPQQRRHVGIEQGVTEKGHHGAAHQPRCCHLLRASMHTSAALGLMKEHPRTMHGLVQVGSGLRADLGVTVLLTSHVHPDPVDPPIKG
jgi:hypothetical protein